MNRGVQMDEKYPPKNRLPTSLPPLRIEIEHEGGVEVFDPNRLIAFVVNDTQRFVNWKPVAGKKSILNAQPALLYRAHDLEIPLTNAEMLRLVSYNLDAWEWFGLRQIYGDFFEIHGDFYSEVGVALQPLWDR
jgi:hypothetical protein